MNIESLDSKNIFSFFEAFFPNYHSSPTIAVMDDLLHIMDDEWEGNESATRRLRNNYNGTDDPNIVKDYHEILASAMEMSIINFMHCLERGSLVLRDSDMYELRQHITLPDGYESI